MVTNKKAVSMMIRVIFALVFTVAFIVMIAGFVFGLTANIPTVEEEDVTKATCESLCLEAKVLDVSEQPNSDYCTKEFSIDLNEDKELQEDELSITCRHPDIGVACEEVTCE